MFAVHYYMEIKIKPALRFENEPVCVLYVVLILVCLLPGPGSIIVINGQGLLTDITLLDRDNARAEAPPPSDFLP